jgi:hypothetical protein
MNPVVGFAAGAAAGVAGVQVGFVHNVEPLRRKRRRQFLGDAIAGIHGAGLKPVTPIGQCC